VTSFLFFSNNADALHVPDNTRRIFACSNPEDVASSEYFAAMHDYMATDGWEQHVWNWLRSIDVNLSAMSKRPPKTQTQNDMHEASKSELDHHISAALKVLHKSGAEFISAKYITETLYLHFPDRFGKNVDRRVIGKEVTRSLRSINKLSKEYDETNKVKVGDEVHSLMAIDRGAAISKEMIVSGKRRAKKFLEEHDLNAFAELVREEFKQH
jgi:hypothetical protein